MNLPLSFRYAATYAGLRKVKSNDLALIVSDVPASAAAIFTRNRMQAAPVKLARKHLEKSEGIGRAILVNAGNANCATRTGDRVAIESCRAAARHLRLKTNQVIPASTGVIGEELPGKLILDALPRLVATLSPNSFFGVADAILTTDTVRKVAHGDVPLKGCRANIAGMTKGAGMIHPNMATTLGFIMTDAGIASRKLLPMLRRAADRSYHRLSVDGDMSTNDTVVVLANGACGHELNAKELLVFEEVFSWVMEDLAEQIASDGEGARKLIRIHVRGATNTEAAGRIARSIANSPLVKTAIAGADPNWGRILSAAGCSGTELDTSKVDIYLQGTRVCRRGLAAEYDEPGLKKALAGDEVVICLQIAGAGRGETRFWTCDFTEDYIRINGSYRT